MAHLQPEVTWEQGSQLGALLAAHEGSARPVRSTVLQSSEISQAHEGQVDRNTRSLWPSSLSSHGRSLQDIKRGSAEVPEDPALTPEDVAEGWRRTHVKALFSSGTNLTGRNNKQAENPK